MEKLKIQYEDFLTPERFATYRAGAVDDDQAWELYRWNLDLVAVVAPLASDLEVALRNTIHQQLTEKLGTEMWWASPNLRLDEMTRSTIVSVVQKHRKKLNNGRVGAGRVVADLSFGTWVMLLGRGSSDALGRPADYEGRIWRGCINQGFVRGTGLNSSGQPRRPMRSAVHDRAQNFQSLRNAAFHHRRISEGVRRAGRPETSARVPLETVWDEAVELLGWMNRPLADLYLGEDKMTTVLRRRPG